MKTALDSSVLLAIANAEPGAEAWMDLLVEARRAGKLVLCEVVLSELAPAFENKDELAGMLDRLGAQLDPIQWDAAWHAGKAFADYRRAGGPREHMIPDFLIAAHAQEQADRLAAIDRGYLRVYFTQVALLAPPVA